MIFEQLLRKIENSKPVNFGDIISNSFELYKTHFSQGLIHALIIVALAIPMMLIVYVPLMPIYMDMIENAGNPSYQPAVMEGLSVGMIILWYVLIFALSFVMQIVNMSVFGHFYRYLKKEDLKTTEDIGSYFTLFKTHFNKLLLVTLATMGIAMLATLLCYIPLLYAMIPLHWIFPMFIFNKELSVSEIVKAAFKYANKNWLIFLALGFVCSIIASLGIIACYIGLLATMFFTHIATYVTYRDTIGFDEESPIDKIGTSSE